MNWKLRILTSITESEIVSTKNELKGIAGCGFSCISSYVSTKNELKDGRPNITADKAIPVSTKNELKGVMTSCVLYVIVATRINKEWIES